jgi:hypothetical protein
MGFHQATIKVEREREFEQLKGAIARACAPENALKFLKAVRSAGLRVRDLDGVIANGVLHRGDAKFAPSGGTSQQLYQMLTVFDRGQLREFYLSQVEEVDPKLRTKFQKLYQYY